MGVGVGYEDVDVWRGFELNGMEFEKDVVVDFDRFGIVCLYFEELGILGYGGLDF